MKHIFAKYWHCARSTFSIIQFPVTKKFLLLCVDIHYSPNSSFPFRKPFIYRDVHMQMKGSWKIRHEVFLCLDKSFFLCYIILHISDPVSRCHVYIQHIGNAKIIRKSCCICWKVHRDHIEEKKNHLTAIDYDMK